MLKHDITEEEIDVKGYTELATLACSLGIVDLKLRMEDQAADEATHAEEMKRLLGE